MPKYKLLDGDRLDQISLNLYLYNIENPPSSPSTKFFNDIPMVRAGLKRVFITGTLAGTLTIISLGNVFKGGHVKLKRPIFSEEGLNDYRNTIEGPHDEYISALSKLISHKVNITRSEAVDKIIAFRSLNENWDGYGALPLQVKSASNAVQLINFLNDSIVEKISDVYPTPNGTVSLVWENEVNERVALEIGNNTLSYYVKLNSQNPIFFNAIKINSKEANTISRFIKAL